MSLTIKYIITCCCGSLPTIGNNRQNPIGAAQKCPPSIFKILVGHGPIQLAKISLMLSKSNITIDYEFENPFHLHNYIRALDRTTSQQSKTKRKLT